MESFKIERVGVVDDHCNDGKIKPIVYFKPNTAFLEYAKNNNNMIRVKISDSDTLKGPYWALVDQSRDIPSSRPNLYKETGYYVLILDTQFGLFPKKLGSFTVDEGIVVPKDLKEKLKAGADDGTDADGAGQILMVLRLLILKRIKKNVSHLPR